MNMHHEVESDLGLRKMDIEHGKVEMLTHTNVAPDTVPSKTAAISFDAALSNRHGKYSEKPRPGETSREVEPATNADFQRSFFSCACRPCSTSVGAVQAEVSETAAVGMALSEVAFVVPRDREHVEEVSKVLSL